MLLRTYIQRISFTLSPYSAEKCLKKALHVHLLFVNLTLRSRALVHNMWYRSPGLRALLFLISEADCHS